MVERVCPAHERIASVKDQQQKAAREKKAAVRAEEARIAREIREGRRAAAKVLRKMPLSELVLAPRPLMPEAYRVAAARYAKLKTWGRDLSGVSFNLRMLRASKLSTGLAWPTRYTVSAGSDVADVHCTIIHELAHVATYEGVASSDHHGARWREVFQAAVSEVVGHHIDVPSNADRFQIHILLCAGLAKFLYVEPQT